MNASDLHLSVGYVPHVRAVGDLRPLLNHGPVTHEEMRSYLMELASPRQVAAFNDGEDLDIGYELKGVSRYRVNFYHDTYGSAVAFRALPVNPPTFAELNLPPTMAEFAMLENGLVLVTGPTGSGKSSALASMIEFANKNRNLHIITIEDPVEYSFTDANCVINQREINRSVKSFAYALRSALREDPDIIMVGEMRDLETVSLAIEAAETGHLVFSTLHSQSAAKTIDRIIDIFPTEAQRQIRYSLSESIQAIISTILVKHISGKIRLPVLEILKATPAVRAIIREGQSFQLANVMSTNRRIGMQTHDDHILQLFNSAQISADVAMRYADDKEFIGKRVGQGKFQKAFTPPK